MRYTLSCLLLLCVACGGGDAPGPSLTTAPSALVSVLINAPTNTIAVGQTMTVTAAGLDGSGAAIAGTTAAWQSSAPTIATVGSTTGLVTGVAAGSAVITATIGSKVRANDHHRGAGCFDVVLRRYAAFAHHWCRAHAHGKRTGDALRWRRGGDNRVRARSVQIRHGERASTDLDGCRRHRRNDRRSHSTDIATSATGSFSASPLAASAFHGEFGAAFESRLRNTELRVLAPLAAGSRGSVLRNMQRASASRSAIVGLPSTPTVGTFFHLNANGTDACTNAQTHTARVAAVSNNAIVVVDSQAPAGGFADSDYVSFAATFDTLIFALDTSAYGAPADIDSNGRVLIFFTQAVNQLTPAGSSGFIGGFFFSRDLFPTNLCATSNDGEMFYLPVVDPTSIYNAFFKDPVALKIQLYGTLAHEFQHLINASRRMYVNNATSPNEEVWLNEGMSHIAEELLYFRESGLTPKSNITLATLQSSPAQLAAVNNYQIQNLLRLDQYLKAPGLNSPYAQNDDLSTRGATYQLLRYSMDESPGTNSSYLHALINSQNAGIVNFNAVFGGTFPDIFTAVQQQVLANFFTGSGVGVDPKYAFPSWNYRDVIGNGLLSPKANPLAMTELAAATATTSFTLTGGGSAYARFAIAPNGTAAITSASGGSAVPADVIMVVVRTH